jgi:prepilin-type processing-associated H-X9-DG protein
MITCKNNLKSLSTLASLYAGDHDDAIPGNGFSYHEEERPPYWHSSWGKYVPYTGERIPNPADYSFWFSKGHLGQYLFDDDYVGDYREHELYACTSSTIQKDQDGNNVPFIFSYWVNVNSVGNLKAPWASNDGINDHEGPRWTRFIEIENPSAVMSIADVAQNLDGTVDASGSFNVIPHFYDDEPTPWPVPSVNRYAPEAYIGPITPTQQGLRASRRGIFDFRHDFGMNTVFIDGHVENIINGGLKNKNIYR